MFDKLQMAEDRYEEINHKLSDPSVIANQDEYRKLMKEHSDLGEIVEKYREYKKVKKDIDDAREILQDKQADQEFREMVQMELKDCEEQIEGMKRI
jgi:peptide chain release factor 1